MTWEIALGIFALVSFAAVIIGWSSKIVSQLSTLAVTLTSLNETLKDFREQARKTHEEFSRDIKSNKEEIARINAIIATVLAKIEGGAK